MEKEFEWGNVVSAIRNSFVGCQDSGERIEIGNCIVEFLAAFSFTDSEMIEALGQAAGMDVETDDFIDEMIANIKA